MPAPGSLLSRETGGFTASELEMMAGDDEVEIVPAFSFQQTHFLAGSYGPFEAKIPAKVPLWVALQLKNRQLCTITTPPWLKKDHLSALVTEEDKTRAESILSNVDFYYQEKAAMLFRNSAESFSGEEGDYNPRVRMRDFEEVREAKLHASWRELDRNVDVIDVNNVCAMEINRLRDFLVRSLDQYQKFDNIKKELRQGEEEEIDESQVGASL